MLGRVLVIALNTYRESLRARFLLALALLSLAVDFYSIILGSFTLKYSARVVTDIGPAATSLVGLVVAVVILATSLYRELEQKTIFPILARPVRRGEYVVGKYLGTLLTLAVFIMANSGFVLMISAAVAGRAVELVMASAAATMIGYAVAAYRFRWAQTFGSIPWAVAMLIAGAALSSGAPDERRVVLGQALLSFLEIAIVAAVATLFSSFSTPIMSAVLTLGVWVIGRNADSLARLPVKFFGEGIHAFGAGLARVVPNLQVYIPPRPLLTGEAVDAKLGVYLGQASLTSAAWAIGLLAIASYVFKKRDFL